MGVTVFRVRNRGAAPMGVTVPSETGEVSRPWV